MTLATNYCSLASNLAGDHRLLHKSEVAILLLSELIHSRSQKRGLHLFFCVMEDEEYRLKLVTCSETGSPNPDKIKSLFAEHGVGMGTNVNRYERTAAPVMSNPS